MGDDPDLYRTFVQIDPPWIPYGIPRDPSRDVGWCTSSPRGAPYVTNKIRLKRCPPRGSTIAIAIEPKVPWSRVRS
jgi:hypothetical protein